MCVICYQICEACDEHQAERLTRAAARLVGVSIDDFEPEKKIEKDKNACMRPASGGCQSASGRGPRTASEGNVSFVPGTFIISSFPEIGSCTEKHWP